MNKYRAAVVERNKKKNQWRYYYFTVRITYFSSNLTKVASRTCLALIFNKLQLFFIISVSTDWCHYRKEHKRRCSNEYNSLRPKPCKVYCRTKNTIAEQQSGLTLLVLCNLREMPRGKPLYTYINQFSVTKRQQSYRRFTKNYPPY